MEKAVRDHLTEGDYKLDYENTIGDLKIRLKYKDINPKRCALSVNEVLMMNDKELNQYVSLKKLAPYREKDWKLPRIHGLRYTSKSRGIRNFRKRYQMRQKLIRTR